MSKRNEYLVCGLILLFFGFVAAFTAGGEVRNAMFLSGIVLIVYAFTKHRDGRADG
jgi:uncharacterized membrane protein HdeD (DUF308 family)